MVWSMEQALFHVLHNWRESDFLLPSFEKWVGQALGLTTLAKGLETLHQLSSYSEQLLGFLSLIDYLPAEDLSQLQAQVSLWEADNQPSLLSSRAASLFNQGQRTAAIALFKEAHAQAPTNWDILLNYAQALIEHDQVDQGFKYIAQAEAGLASTGETHPKVYYLYAKVCRKLKNMDQALGYIQRAIDHTPANDYYYELVTIQLETRRFNEAIGTLNRVPQRDFRYYQVLAAAYAQGQDYPGAIKSLNEAHLKYDPTPDTLTQLASYYRHNYEQDQARRTLARIPDSHIHPLARIELAKIEKASGKLYLYQQIMETLLTEAKQQYRQTQPRSYQRRSDES